LNFVKNKFGYPTLETKHDRQRTQAGRFIHGTPCHMGSVKCSVCGGEMYEYEETADAFYYACHGWIIDPKGRHCPCPNNADYHDPNKHWKPNARTYEQLWQLYYLSPDMFEVMRRPVGRKVA